MPNIILNIGLEVQGRRYSTLRAIETVAELMPRVYYDSLPWFISRSNTEDTLVVRAEVPQSIELVAHQVALINKALRQEDTAYMVDGQGFMTTGAWGAFNPEYFRPEGYEVSKAAIHLLRGRAYDFNDEHLTIIPEGPHRYVLHDKKVLCIYDADTKKVIELNSGATWEKRHEYPPHVIGFLLTLGALP